MLGITHTSSDHSHQSLHHLRHPHLHIHQSAVYSDSESVSGATSHHRHPHRHHPANPS